MRIAILGTRGIPARYGGFETFAEELSVRLVTRGHQVTVFGRRPFFSTVQETLEYKGVKILNVPTIFHKYFETPLHGLFSFVAASKRDFDVILLCNAANSPFSWILNLKRLPFAVNVDGIERKRAKWNALGKLWYWLGERASVLFASKVIADAHVIRDYYKKQYSCEATVIPYGASALHRDAGKVLENFGLEAGKYLLYVSRLEPENNALGVVQAYCQSGVAMPLVVVGDAPYGKAYIERLKEAANDSVVFTGFQFGEAYEELQSNCYLYIQATEVGGTHPALIEAMAYANCVVANETPENKEVLGDVGVYYQKNNFETLASLLNDLANNPGKAKELGNNAKKRAEALYSWEKVSDAYEELLCSLVK
ncbi:MAG: glycosyltransferase family 1 protein [SAR324 cluster bacterium]|uniref:Glycosyltransferase family 1 protein n=1 Tax=SAR324 cluster bacterium TaxID=2024889 RepID=A0A7X9IL54_9DELT|nr:glycosyltransferase family 1 protein [SAR324 cluster bacterium]